LSIRFIKKITISLESGKKKYYPAENKKNKSKIFPITKRVNFVENQLYKEIEWCI